MTQAIEQAKERVRKAKQSLEKLIKEKKFDQLKPAIEEYENAIIALKRLLEPPQPPSVPLTGRSHGDPHFVGFDGQRYDIMPKGAAIVFAVKEQISHSKKLEKPFCVTGLHKSFGSTEPNPPTWTTAVVIKVYENTIYYDVDNNLVLNGAQASPVGILSSKSDSQSETALPGYYYYRGHQLDVWHPVFGRVVVHNCGSFNFCITVSIPQQLGSQMEGMVTGKQQNAHQLWEQQKEVDKQKFQQLKTSNPSLDDDELRDLLFDYKFTPVEIRDQVLQENIVTVGKQQQLIEKEKKIDPNQFQILYESGLISSFGPGYECRHFGSYKGPSGKYRITVTKSEGHPDLYITSSMSNHPIREQSTSSSWSLGCSGSSVAIYHCAGNGTTYEYQHPGGEFHLWLRDYGNTVVRNAQVVVQKL